MKLHNRISLIILVIFISGWLVAGVSAASLELGNARRNTVGMAEALLSAASAVRSYTTDNIGKLDINDQNGQIFIPEIIPSFAAQQVFSRLGAQYKNYRYKEAALNPTNPKDLPTDWQVKVIQYLIENPNVTEVVDTYIDLNNQESLYVAQPIQITLKSCLQCHSTPEIAPPSQLKTYGNGGFGWKLNEIIGARFIEIPTSLPQQQARQAIVSYLLLIASILLLAYCTVLLIVKVWITKPLDQLSTTLEEMSKNPLVNHAQLPKTKIPAIRRINDSINRLINSLNYSYKSQDK